MTASSGWSIQSVRGTVTTWSAWAEILSLPSVATAITCAPRARTSCMFDTTLSSTGESVATVTTGVSWSSRAIGPCFISPAAYASVEMYEISLSFNAPSRATGSPTWRPR